MDIEAADAAIDINNTSTDPLIHFQVSGTTNFTIGTDVTDSKKFKIGTTALETGTAVTVQSTGEVGIGTTSPTYGLHSVENAQFGTLHGTLTVNSTSGAWINNHATEVYGNTEAGFSTLNVLSAHVAGSDRFLFSAYQTTNVRFVIQTDGNVGIGTSTPSEALEINGNLVVDTIIDNPDIAMTMENSWVVYDAVNFASPEYYMDKLGRVHLQGLIKSGTVNAGATTLPAGYRPLTARIFIVGISGGYCRVDVKSTGVVYIDAGCTNTFLSLDGISFKAEQ